MHPNITSKITFLISLFFLEKVKDLALETQHAESSCDTSTLTTIPNTEPEPSANDTPSEVDELK